MEMKGEAASAPTEMSSTNVREDDIDGHAYTHILGCFVGVDRRWAAW